jgi:hypothetical protein
MRRKFALLLTMTLLLTMILNPEEAKKASAAGNSKQVIDAIGIMDTDKGSNENGADMVTRGRFAQMLVNLSTFRGTVSSKSNGTLYSDVKNSYWASGYIQKAITQGWMFGYLNGKFKPDQGITLQEAVYGVLKLLGYTNSDFSGNLTGSLMTLYQSKGLNKNINKAKTDIITINDCRNLFYNTLKAYTRDGKVYAETLGYSLDSYGEVDYLSLINTDISGPVIVDKDWRSEIPFSVGEAALYKYGKECDYTDINDYDVLYYSEKFHMIWIYDDKVTGTIEKINPDYSAPQSVTLGGKEYTFADSDAAIQFSTIGDLKEGQSVTLLLGKDSKVIDVLSIDEYNTTITGVVLEVGSHLAEDAYGKYTYNNYVKFVDASGTEYQQDYDKNILFLDKGDLVRMKYQDGNVTLSEYTQDMKSFGNNTFGKDGNTLGDLALASNVKILDLNNSQYISVYPERLTGVMCSMNSIYYYELNENGEISQLIFNNLTGDLDEYGVFTGINIQSTSTSMIYEYLTGNEKGSITVKSVAGLSIEKGPIGLVFENNNLISTYALTGITVSSIGNVTIQSGNSIYPLAKDYVVYFLLKGEYIATTLDKVSDLKKYKLNAYYDSPVSLGGRIRVIVAESIS